jgi:cytochrome P450
MRQDFSWALAHFCVGANLARAEIIEALAFLAPRMRHLRPDGEPVFGTPTGIYTMRSLPVRFTPCVIASR